VARIGRSSSRGRITASGWSAGPANSRRRLPPSNRTMIWRPSAPTRSTTTPPSSLTASARAPSMLVGTSGITVGRTSRRQNTCACAAVSCGSIAKGKPPTPTKALGRAGLRVGVGSCLVRECVVIFLISYIAAQELPGETRPVESRQVLILRDRPPVRCRWHHKNSEARPSRGRGLRPTETNLYRIGDNKLCCVRLVCAASHALWASQLKSRGGVISTASPSFVKVLRTSNCSENCNRREIWILSAGV
jgi:hypothetical protein